MKVSKVKLDAHVERIKTTMDEFLVDHLKYIETGNKQASKRARVSSIKLNHLFKEYRKHSINSSVE